MQEKGDDEDGLGGSGNLVLKEEESATLAAIFFLGIVCTLCSFPDHHIYLFWIGFGSIDIYNSGYY